MKKIYLLALALISSSVILSGCTSQNEQPVTTENTETTEAEMEQMDELTQQIIESEMAQNEANEDVISYTLEEVAQHATKDDCWTIIDGEIFDLTSITKAGTHTGGPVIEKACGTDGSALFNDRSGKGPHPEKAENTLDGLMIGILAE